jgi:archaellum component FlaG (FlaF/FlaG flagellin family)
MRAKKSSKKGFGDAVSTLIMFIAVISVTTGLVIAFMNYVDTTQQSFNKQTTLSSNKLRTSVSISNVHYDSTGNVF